jgi:hypothetical protein
MNTEYQKYIKDAQKTLLQNRILTIMTGIGFSIALAETLGIGVYSLITYVNKK